MPSNPKSVKTTSASKLPKEFRERLKRALQRDVVQSMIASLETHPPELDIDDIEVVLLPGGKVSDLNHLLGRGGVCGNAAVEGTLNIVLSPEKTEVEAVAHSLRIKLHPHPQPKS